MLEIKVGTVLAKEGEWQRKYQITHINTVATTQQWDRVAISFSVCLKYLGEFWADGRSKPSLKQPEREVKTSQTAKEKLWLGWYSVDKKWDGSRLKN